MIMFGKNIIQPGDPLQKASIEQLVKVIRQPSEQLINQTNQLRMVQSIDATQFKMLKKNLPYFVTALFNPPLRKTENFAQITYFVLDIDHIHEKEFSINELIEKLKSNEHIVFMFVSPSNDGLKIVFRLQQACFDHAQYSLFYKVFATQFSQHYNLNQVIDTRTSDVTRACFICADANAYYNENASPVIMSDFVNFDYQMQIRETQAQIAVMEANQQIITTKEEKQELTADILSAIKQKLNPNIRTQKAKQVYVPEKLEEIMAAIQQHLLDYQIQIREITNINYGKKITVEVQNLWAEVNVFYGRKGFSLVKTPKNGSNPELMEITYKVLCELLI